MEKLRNNSAYPGFFPGLRIFARTVTQTGGPFNVVIETGCTAILFVIGYAGTTLIAPTIGSSSSFSGAKTVTFANPSGGVLKYLVVGSNEQDDGIANSGAITITDFETETVIAGNIL
jgi:hypothetical protein